MTQVIKTTTNIDEFTEGKIKELSEHPLITEIVVFPNCHYDKGVIKGINVITKNCIIPGIISRDLGCGVRAVKTDYVIKDGPLLTISKNTLRQILKDIVTQVPIGLGNYFLNFQGWGGFATKFPHISTFNEEVWANPMFSERNPGWLKQSVYSLMRRSLGILGGKDHFVELHHDKKGSLWVTTHVGSGMLGFAIRNYYKEQARKFLTTDQKKVANIELADIPIINTMQSTSTQFFNDLNFANIFAEEGRSRIIKTVITILNNILGEVRILSEHDLIHNTIEHLPDKIVHRSGTASPKAVMLHPIIFNSASKTLLVERPSMPEYNTIIPYSGRTLYRHLGNTLKQEDCDKVMNNVVTLGWDLNTIKGVKAKKSIDLSGSPKMFKDLSKVLSNKYPVTQELTPIASLKG